jgi:hypothetical protein
VASNPVYQNGLAITAQEFKSNMDQGRVPNFDGGSTSSEEYAVEMYAELFAFMSLVSADQATRDDYAQRARTLLMYVMNIAVLGPADGQPFRQPIFATYDSDRSRYSGEAFALTVDWIYPYLTAADKTTIRTVFLRWSNEIATNSYGNGSVFVPTPGVFNSPALVPGPERRWAGNNYFTAHMRNLGLMAMALDPADDPGNTLHAYLRNATGGWLYMVDYLMRNDARGGLFPEGFEYSPQTLSYVTQFLLALRTAGQDDAATWGPQVVLTGNSFWDDLVAAHLHSLSPVTALTPPDDGSRPVYQPAWYGDAQNYWAPDLIAVFSPLGVYDQITGNPTRLSALRWIQTNTAPGLAAGLTSGRARGFSPNYAVTSILYFLLFDPAAAAPADPRLTQPLSFFAGGLGRILARTSWGTDATWFTYKLGWNTIDHQHADGNQFEFYRRGEWLTKELSGYDNNGPAVGSSDYHNTLALQNSQPDRTDYRFEEWQRGTQWFPYSAAGDGVVLARSDAATYAYIMGDATNLYNSISENVTDISHASRSIVWLKPDYVVVYDRAVSKTAGRFKRFWLNFPNSATVTGNRTRMVTATGQQLFVNTLLPANATITTAPREALGSDVAAGEPMQFRLQVEAPGGPASARFLHVLQGADAGATADAVALVQSTSGNAFAGAVVKNTAVMFPVDVSTTFTGVTYQVPAGTTLHRVTGLVPSAAYDVTVTGTGAVTVTITPSATGATRADSGGLLSIGAIATPPTVSLDRTSLMFGAVSSSAAFTSQTPAQTVRIMQTGAGTVTWTAAATTPWLAVSPASGTGPATLTISTRFAAGLAASQTGNVAVTFAGAANAAGPINVTLAVVSSTAPASPPFGSFDTPAGDATVLAGSIALTGWTLDNVGVKQVELWRDLRPGETTPPGNTTPGDPRNGKIFISYATFVDNARPDVEALYPTTPSNYRAGWGYLMLSWGLFGQGNGTYKFYAFGVDQEGNTSTIGTKTVVISNNTATKPFGSIDTPAIGGDASGPNFGWGLTPRVNNVATCKIQPSGVQVSIDSGPLQPVVYGSDVRADIAGAFTGFSNSAAAGGHYIFDWTTLTNGAHTIGWLITDDCNRADGVGSRFFNVTTGTSLVAATPDFRLKAEATDLESVASAFRRKEDDLLVAHGYGELPVILEPDSAGARAVDVPQGDRIELRAPRGYHEAYQLGPDGQRRLLPAGATWDGASAILYWQPAPGFLGRYRLVFSNGSQTISVRVVVVP